MLSSSVVVTTVSSPMNETHGTERRCGRENACKHNGIWKHNGTGSSGCNEWATRKAEETWQTAKRKFKAGVEPGSVMGLNQYVACYHGFMC